MKSMINAYLEKFNALTAREKNIFFATLLIVVWGAWDSAIYQPILKEHDQLTNKLSSVKTQLSTLQQAAKQIESLGKTDPNQANKQKLAKVKVELQKLKQQLDIGDKKFVPAGLMAEVLRDMLRQNSGLTLVKLETLPVTTLSESSQQQSWVYRHGLSMTLSGNYFNTLAYLKSLESLPWRFNWNTINYQVIEYPVAETTLNIYTLSFEENWLGL